MRLLGVVVGLGLGLAVTGVALAAVDRSPRIVSLVSVNHPPRITLLALSPSDATRLDTVTARAAASDADGTRVFLGYRWLHNGSVIAGATGRSINLAAHAIHRGDRIAVRVTAGDGVLHVTRTSAAVIVHDAPPVIERVTIDQHSPAGDATLTATLRASDPDQDALTEQRTWSWSCPGFATGTAGSHRLDLAAHGIGPGCQVELADRVSDGLKTATATAAAVTVIDRAPVVGAVTLSPAAPTASDVVTATAPVADPDGDATTTSCTWLLDETPLSETSCTLDLAAAGATRGQTLDVALSAGDGTLTTSSFASTAIADASPVVSSLSIDKQSPQTNDTLSAVVTAADADGDPLSLQYRWLVNGSPITGATHATFDLSHAGNGDRGDQISVEVRASDGESSSPWAAVDAVTVANTPPVLDPVSLSADQPIGGSPISILSPAVGDADGDPVTTGVTWKLNGVAFDSGADTTVPVSAVRGDTLTAVVTANDGTDTATGSVEATIADTPPVVSSVSIDNVSPQTDDTLSAVVAATDADGDSLTTQYRWLNNGSPIDGATGATLDLSQAGNGDHGDQISVEARAWDGEAWSNWSASEPATIGNTSPQVTAATIAYDPATGTATLDTSSSDADSDPLTIAVAWTINGQDAGSASTLDLHQAGAHLGDVIGARVQVTDSGAAVSGWLTATPVTAATGPPALVDSAVMPWAIMKQSYTVGTTDVIYTDGSNPSNGPLSLSYSSGGTCASTSGANDYKNEITGAVAVCPLSIGQIVATKTGQNAGPTSQGLIARITSYQSVDQIAQVTASGGYIITSPASLQLVRIPIVENAVNGSSVWPSASGTVRVVGFAWAVITGYTNAGVCVDVWIVGSTV